MTIVTRIYTERDTTHLIFIVLGLLAKCAYKKTPTTGDFLVYNKFYANYLNI